MVYNGKPIKMDEIGGYPYLRKPPYKSSMSKALAMPSQYSFLVPRRRGQRTRTDPKLISTRWCPPSYTWIYHCRYRWSMDIPLWISSPVTVEISAINHGEIGLINAPRWLTMEHHLAGMSNFTQTCECSATTLGIYMVSPSLTCKNVAWYMDD